jgi:hypothetical protein
MSHGVKFYFSWYRKVYDDAIHIVSQIKWNQVWYILCNNKNEIKCVTHQGKVDYERYAQCHKQRKIKCDMKESFGQV